MEEKKNKDSFGRVIRINQDIIDHIAPQVTYPETFSDCLRRLLKLKKKEVKSVKARVASKN